MSNANEMVVHPKHYNNESGVECIDVIRYLPFSLGSAIKYVWRFRDKWNPTEDLEKAKFYLEDYETSQFKSKNGDDLFHTLTTNSANFIYYGEVRTKLRLHTVYLEKQEHPEAEFFSAFYDYMQKAAANGVVDYTRFGRVKKAVENLLEDSTTASAAVAAEFAPTLEASSEETTVELIVGEDGEVTVRRTDA